MEEEIEVVVESVLSQVGRQVRRDIERLKACGFDIRQYTPEEIKERVEAMGKTQKQKQLPLEDRLQQVRMVNKIVAERGVYVYEACEQVGITAGNYKQINRLYGNQV